METYRLRTLTRPGEVRYQCRATCWGDCIDRARRANVNFSNLDFSYRDLRNVSFMGMNLTQSSFAGSRLAGCRFDRADLTEVSFVRAQAHRAWFAEATMSFANCDHAGFADTSFVRARLDHAQLMHTDFNGANLSDAVLLNARTEMATIARTMRDAGQLSAAQLDHYRGPLYDLLHVYAAFGFAEVLLRMVSNSSTTNCGQLFDIGTICKRYLREIGSGISSDEIDYDMATRVMVNDWFGQFALPNLAQSEALECTQRWLRDWVQRYGAEAAVTRRTVQQQRTNRHVRNIHTS